MLKKRISTRSSSVIFTLKKNVPRGQRGIAYLLGQYRLPNSPHAFLLSPQSSLSWEWLTSPQLFGQFFLAVIVIEYNRILQLEGTLNH